MLLLLTLTICIMLLALWFLCPQKILTLAFQLYQKQRMVLWLGKNIIPPTSASLILFKQNSMQNAIMLRQLTKMPITIVLSNPTCKSGLLKLLWKNNINIINPKEIYTWQNEGLLILSLDDYRHYKKADLEIHIGYICGNSDFHYQGNKRLIPQYFQLHLQRYNPTTNLSVTAALKRLETKSWFDYIDKHPPLISLWLKQAKIGKKSLAVADSTGSELSHHRLLTAVLSFSKHFHSLLEKEPIIGICLPASVGATITTLSLLSLNKTIVNLNYTANKNALLSALTQSKIQTVITSYRFIDQLKKNGFDIIAVFDNIKLIYLEDVKQTLSKTHMLKHLLMAKFLPATLISRYLHIQKNQLADPLFIIFSSGSEGSPKGVKLSHQNILGNIKQATSLLMEVEQDGTLMSTLPIFHGFGLTATLLMPLVEGIPFVSHPDPRDAVAIGHLVNQHKATILFGTSTFFRLYAKSRGLKPHMFESLRLIITGAERLLPEVRTLFECKFNKPICEGYGTTELSPAASSNIPHKPHDIPNKLGTVGHPLPGCEVRIVDNDTLEDLACGEPGHILIGGVNVMQGYLNNPTKTNDVLVKLDGISWYKTGDKGHIDSDGFLSILGRYSRFAKLGGEMISLYAIERLIRDIIQDEEILLLTTAITDTRKGEAIVLLLSGPIEVDEIKQLIMKSEMSNLMKPQHYLKMDQLPILGSGKRDFASAKKCAEKAFGEKEKVTAKA